MNVLRPIAALVAGCAIWWFLFLAVGIAFGLLWPDYREAARLMFDEDDLSHFTTPMLFVNFVVFAAAGIVAGWLAALIGGSRLATLSLTLLFFIVMAYNHYVRVWEALPAWYNVVVPVVIAGTVTLGGRLFRGVPEQSAR